MLYRKKVTVYIRNNLEKINDIIIFDIIHTRAHTHIFMLHIIITNIIASCLNFFKPIKRKQNTIRVIKF